MIDRFDRLMHPPRRAYPTRAGLFALAAPIALGVAAVNASNNLLFMLLGGVLGAIILSGLLSEKNIRGVAVDVQPVGVAYVDEPTRVEVRFAFEEPHDPKRSAFALKVKERKSRSLFSALWLRDRGFEGLTVILPLLDRQSAPRLGTRTFRERGPARLGPCELSTRYPFGLLTKVKDLDVEVDFLVRPRRVPVPAVLGDPKNVAAEGDIASRRGLGLEVYGLRERESRDPLHRLHGLRSLSLGRDVVLETAGDERPIAWLGVANLQGADPVAFERALEIVSAALVEWDEQGYLVGLATVNHRYPPGTTSLSFLLDVLAALGLEVPDQQAQEVAPPLWIAPIAAALDGGVPDAQGLASDGALLVRVDRAGVAGVPERSEDFGREHRAGRVA